MPDLCKSTDCNFVFPILETEALGNSLSSINLNFRQLDIELCNLEDKISRNWNPAFTVFSENSAKWLDAYSITFSNSACWQNTFNTVLDMSGFWLKPITLVYPYPFSTATSLEDIRVWLNENFPVKNGNCYNFIVGQQLYIHSPEYTTITRRVNDSRNVGTRVVSFVYRCDCIGRGAYVGTAFSNVDCGGVSIDINVDDQYINKFVGIKFTVNESYEWSDGTKIFE